MRLARSLKSRARWSLCAVLLQSCGSGTAPTQTEPASPSSPLPDARHHESPTNSQTPACSLALRAEFDHLGECSTLESEFQDLPKPLRLRLPQAAQVKPCWRGSTAPAEHKTPSPVGPVDASILDEAAELATCRPEHPIARIPRIVAFRSSMRMDFNVMGRDLKYLLDRCGDGGDRTPRVQMANRIAYDLTPDLTYCQAEFSGDPLDPDPRMQLHQLLTIRGRKIPDREKAGDIYEFVGLNFHVPEKDWPYVAGIVQASARSLTVDWPALDARTKRAQDPQQKRPGVKR